MPRSKGVGTGSPVRPPRPGTWIGRSRRWVRAFRASAMSVAMRRNGRCGRHGRSSGLRDIYDAGRRRQFGALADADIAALMAVGPASPFPARIAVARIQAPGYASGTKSGYGTGRYSVVTVRDIEDKDSFARIFALPMVGGTPLGPLSLITLGLLPDKKAFVSSTTSGALVDVRTGFLYGVSEATEREEQLATIRNTQDIKDS